LIRVIFKKESSKIENVLVVDEYLVSDKGLKVTIAGEDSFFPKAIVTDTCRIQGLDEANDLVDINEG